MSAVSFCGLALTFAVCCASGCSHTSEPQSRSDTQENASRNPAGDGAEPHAQTFENAHTGLRGYAEKDFRNLDDRSTAEFWRIFSDLTGDPLDEKRDGLELRLVSRFRSGKANWIVVEVYPGFNVPDVSGARVHLFDGDWNRVATSIFPTGYRMILKEVHVKWNAELEQDLLVVWLTSSGSRKDSPGSFETQYYAFRDDSITLIRCEDSEKKFRRNTYRGDTPGIGVEIPKRATSEWIQSLHSTSAVEQLATLVWLSGGHLPSDEARYNQRVQESVHDSELFEAVRDSPATKRALDRLRTSKLEWIREQADCAATQAIQAGY